MSSASDSKEIKGIADTQSIGQSSAARVAKRNGCGDLEKLVSHLIKSSPAAEIDKNRKTIAVFGPTGSGKSTLITACLGGKLRKDDRGRIVNDGSPIAHIGHSNTSETLYPKIYTKQTNVADSKSASDLAFMDLPGSKDNRGPETLYALVGDFSTNLKLALEGPAAIDLKERELQSCTQTIDLNTKQIQFLQTNPDQAAEKEAKLKHRALLTGIMAENKAAIDKARPELAETKRELTQKRKRILDINTSGYEEYFQETYTRSIKDLWFPSIRWFSKEFSIDTKGRPPFAHIEESPKDKPNSPKPKWDPKKRIWEPKKGLYKSSYCTDYGEDANATVRIYVNKKDLPDYSTQKEVIAREIRDLEIREKGLEAEILAKETSNTDSTTALNRLFGLIQEDEKKLREHIVVLQQTKSFAEGRLPTLKNELDFLRQKQFEVLTFIKKINHFLMFLNSSS